MIGFYFKNMLLLKKEIYKNLFINRNFWEIILIYVYIMGSMGLNV